MGFVWDLIWMTNTIDFQDGLKLIVQKYWISLQNTEWTVYINFRKQIVNE